MIEITNVNPINKGDILASCTVAIRPWKMKINKVLVFRKGQNTWVTLPREKFETRDGEVKYTDLIEFDDNGATKRFRDQVVGAVEDYMARNGDMVPEDVIKEDQEFPF